MSVTDLKTPGGRGRILKRIQSYHTIESKLFCQIKKKNYIGEQDIYVTVLHITL